MNPGTDCEQVRLRVMAALDGEASPDAADPRSDVRTHLTSCASCSRWLRDVESMNARFQGVSYPNAPVDLWGTVKDRLREPEPVWTVHRLWPIGVLVLVWRALQLLIDLPFPMLHPVVPLAGALAALWLIASDPLAIETFAPELDKEAPNAIP